MTEFQSYEYVAHRQLLAVKRYLPQAIVLSMLVAVAVTAVDYVLFSSVNAFYWLLALLLTSALRGVYPTSLIDQDMSAVQIRKATRVLVSSAVVAGLVWGAAAFFLFDTPSTANSAFLLILLAGVACGGLMCYGVWPMVFGSFLSALVFSAALGLTVRAPSLGWLTVLATLVYLSLLLVGAKRIRAGFLANLRLRGRTQDLQRQLSERDQRLHQLQIGVDKNLSFIDIARMWSWETDSALKMTHLSNGFQKITGVPLDSVLGYPLDRLFLEHPQAVNYRLADLYKRMETRQSLLDFEILMKRLDGSVITIAINGEPSFDQHKRFLGYRGTARDVTSQKAQIRKLEFEATHDSLTRLINRRTFLSVLENSLAQLDGRFVPLRSRLLISSVSTSSMTRQGTWQEMSFLQGSHNIFRLSRPRLCG